LTIRVERESGNDEQQSTSAFVIASRSARFLFVIRVKPRRSQKSVFEVARKPFLAFYGIDESSSPSQLDMRLRREINTVTRGHYE
jgi:hypothetical protein